MTTYDVMVIGSGAYGAATVFHLAERGMHVALLERGALNSQTSMRAAGLATAPHGMPESTQIACESLTAFMRFEEITGQPLRVWQTGSLKVARKSEHVSQLEAEVALAGSEGVDAELVDAAFVASHAPFYDADRVLAARWTPADLYLEPGDVPRGYLRGAAILGAELLQNAEVQTVDPLSGGGFVVRLADGRTFESRVVVNAAGAWCRALATGTGVNVPALAIRHQLFISGPVDGVLPDQPCVRVTDEAAYIRPEGTGLMFGAYEPDPPEPVAHGPKGGIHELELDIAPLRRVLARSGVPALLDAPVAELRGGLPTVTPDGRWLIDEAPECPGYFVICGDNVGGLSTAPAVGKSVAGWIAENGGRPRVLEPFRLDRFDRAHCTPERFFRLCRDRYVNQYARLPSVAGEGAR